MDKIEETFKAVPRREFLPPDVQDRTDFDVALPIGFGQTNSQPYTVGKMLEWLEAKAGDKVLDVGSGSGWTTALLAHIVGPQGKVYGVEKVPELLGFGRENCRRLGIKNVKFYEAKPGIIGLPEHAPYDCILVSASTDKVPDELLAQLKIRGKLILPVGYDILEVIKSSESEFETFKHSGFIFVPLIK